jgi:phosphatidylserine/phosphatidylglycerophosphate/cardiolipin synthase-like enzyme
VLDAAVGPAQLVITAPEPYGSELAYRTKCRTTLGVLIELLAQAKNHVVISAPFLQAGAGLTGEPLSWAVQAALDRGVHIDVVSTGASLRTLTPLPRSDVRLKLYRPHANIIDDTRLGSHAKFCLADGKRAYVGSANLTGPGLSEHFEMGILICGDIAHQIQEFWDYAREIGLFVAEVQT